METLHRLQDLWLSDEHLCVFLCVYWVIFFLTINFSLFLLTVVVLYVQGIGTKEWREVSMLLFSVVFLTVISIIMVHLMHF